MTAPKSTLHSKLEALEQRYEMLATQLNDPAVIRKQEHYQQVARAYRDLEDTVLTFRQQRAMLQRVQEARDIIGSSSDAELVEMAQMELEESSQALVQIDQRLKAFLLPKDPNEEKNTIVEIRAGTGGDEAALFAAVLYRMYSRYAERMKWKKEELGSNPTGIGGFKEVVFSLSGRGVFGRMKYESGVHRVQRVPATEASGRIHTSAASVAVLPEAEEVDVEIRDEDLKIDVYRSTGPGGQSVNTTDSAVRITHLPTGLVVHCQDEKSQHKNRAKALKVLRARLLDAAIKAQQQEVSQNRKLQVGSGDRSAKIRTYNFPQGRVSDHRIGLTLYKLDQIIDGDLDEVIEALRLADEAEKMQQAYQDGDS